MFENMSISSFSNIASEKLRVGAGIPLFGDFELFFGDFIIIDGLLPLEGDLGEPRFVGSFNCLTGDFIGEKVFFAPLGFCRGDAIL